MQQCGSNSRRNCPECRAKIDDPNDLGREGENSGNVIHSVRVIQSAIGNCTIRCKNTCLEEDEMDEEYFQNNPNMCRECDWTGKLSDWPIHASRECSIEIISCPISGCTHKCPRKDMKAHVGSSKCIQSAVNSQLQDKLDDYLSEMQHLMKKEVEKQVSKLRKEKGQLEARIQRETNQRRVLEEENEHLCQKLDGLKRKHVSTIRKKKHCVCPACFASEDLKMCTGCHQVVFCSEVCQRAFWPEHKKDCLLAQRQKQLLHKKKSQDIKKEEHGNGKKRKDRERRKHSQSLDLTSLESSSGDDKKTKKRNKKARRARAISADIDVGCDHMISE